MPSDVKMISNVVAKVAQLIPSMINVDILQAITSLGKESTLGRQSG